MVAAAAVERDLEQVWRDALRPPPRYGVVDWAEANVILSERITSRPGPYRVRETPYLREPLEAFAARDVQTITLCFGPQTAKTTAIKMMAAFAIDYDPGPILWVFPSGKFAKSFSRGHLLPLLSDCAVLRRHLPADRKLISLLEYQLNRCTLNLEGAGSPANMASRPVRYLFLDEVDKYRKESSEEAGSAKLAEKRTRTFWNRKIIKTSTPTVPSGEIWVSFLSGDRRYYHVPCPHCKTKQRLEIKYIVIPPECRRENGEWDLDAVEEQSYYQCQAPDCRQRINDGHKPAMLADGEWVPTHRAKQRSYHLSSIYSPWVKFGELARLFLECKDNPEKLHDFVNSEQAEPWELRGEAAGEKAVLARRANYESGTLPVPVRHLLLTVDVQSYGFWYVLRGWTKHGTSYLVRWGLVESLEALDTIAGGIYPINTGGMQRVTRVFIDSGAYTKRVYDICRARAGWIPIKGAGSNGGRSLSVSRLPAEGLRLVTINVDTYKDALQRKYLIRSGDVGAWYLPADCPPEYAAQLCAEEVIEERGRYGYIVRKWRQTRRDNHLGDDEVYQLAGADLLGVRVSRRRIGGGKPGSKTTGAETGAAA